MADRIIPFHGQVHQDSERSRPIPRVTQLAIRRLELALAARMPDLKVCKAPVPISFCPASFRLDSELLQAKQGPSSTSAPSWG